jgi:hypothetical protein
MVPRLARPQSRAVEQPRQMAREHDATLLNVRRVGVPGRVALEESSELFGPPA